MAKKKKKSSESSKRPEYFTDLFGILLILISILGIGKYGPVGKILSSFSLFLVGSLYVFLMIFVMGLGVYIIIKRDKINLFNSKLIGIYLFVIGIIVFLHQNYVLENIETSKIITASLDNITLGIENIMNGEVAPGLYNIELANTGGGILGALFSTLFYKMFEADGTNIVVWVLLISGFMIFTGLSIADIVRDVYDKGKNIIPKKEKGEVDSTATGKVKINDNNLSESEPESDKIVIHSLDDLAKNQDLNKKIEPVTENVVRNKNYIKPSLDLLDNPPKNKKGNDRAVIEKNSDLLVKVLADFGIIGKVVEVNIGPTVIQYELQLNQGTKVSKLLGIDREIALSLAKKEVRIQAPIPGKNTVGIEMPNEEGTTVTLKETLAAIPKNLDNVPLVAGLGKDIMGKVAYCHIDRTPHMLVAGATGSGKSVCINSIIISILLRSKPEEVKLMLIDPKKVELSIYNGVPHLLRPVITDSKEASVGLKKIVGEMERRYTLFEESGAKNIASYNKIIEDKNKKLKDEDKMNIMPYIVVIIDELADLMIVAAKDVEESVTRITQLARAAGIHLIVATQRPSTDVVTGLIKANIPSRLSFAVSSSIDSRTILDMKGAEKLLGKGDMLFLPMGENVPQRIQGAFVSEEEIKRVTDFTIEQQKAQYDGNFLVLSEREVAKANNGEGGYESDEEYDDPLYNDIVEFVITSRKASASLLQRRFKLGYNRAARIVDLLEERGIVGPQNGSKPREVLVELELDNYNEE